MTLYPSARAPDAGTGAEIAASLLPQPKQVEALGGTLPLPDLCALHLPEVLPDPERGALNELRELCAHAVRVHLVECPPAAAPPPGGITVRLEPEEAAGPGTRPHEVDAERWAQGYRLRVGPAHVELVGNTPPGLFYGVQTLRQLVRTFARDWPCMEIRDLPDFAVRGLSHDVTRGKVPKLETLKELGDRLAEFKMNHLQLYVEHTFAFQFNAHIGGGCSPLTAEEVRELDSYCVARRIELVPALASFGHMGFVLSLPEYRHLAEVEATVPWAQMSWRERMHGLTLDASNPQSRMLLEHMYAEFLPLFSSRLVNVTCDETYDLGQGKNQRRAAEFGLGRLYLEHLCWLHQLCGRFGKRMMLWGDIVKRFPELLTELPRDVIVLNWGYAPAADYESTALFRDAGLTTYVCPGTSAWNRVINDIDSADLNIRRYAAAGVQYGAVGLLNTDWGDDGHFNLLAGSWHPIVLGAAMGWNTAGPPPQTFDRVFSRLVWEDESGALVQTLRRVVSASNLPRSWPTFYAPLTETIPQEPWSESRVERWRTVSLAAAEQFRRHRVTGRGAAQDLRELQVACRMNALVAERIQVSRALAVASGNPDRVLVDRLRRFASDCETLAALYEQVWLARNKRSNLVEILAVFQRLAKEARSIAAREATGFDAEQHYGERMRVFASERVEPGGIVFVGSSHIERFDTAALLPGWRIINRGISADRTGITERGILHRLDVSVFDCRPSYILLENGANDLGELWRTGRPTIEEIADGYAELVAAIRARLPQVPMCLVNVAPTTGPHAGLSPLAPLLNRQIERIAARFGCQYMDLYRVVVNDAGELRWELTDDGLHLNALGYRSWAEIIAPYLEAALGG
ncbi:MAG: GDSL-type esterase/lipase family protein [Planctomycetota bacterium]